MSNASSPLRRSPRRSSTLETPQKKARSVTSEACSSRRSMTPTAVRRSPRTSSPLEVFLSQHTRQSQRGEVGLLHLKSGDGFEDGIKSLLLLLKDSIAQEGIDIQYDIVDRIMSQIKNLSEHADSNSVRACQELITKWEYKQSGAHYDNVMLQKRIHMFAAAVSAAFITRVVHTHGISVPRRMDVSSYNDPTDDSMESLELTFSDICALGWLLNLSVRYSGDPATYFDVQARAVEVSQSHRGQHDLSLMMQQWRHDVNKQVEEIIPPDGQLIMHAWLDMLAVDAQHPNASDQSRSRSKYILAHGGHKRDGQWVKTPSKYWTNAFDGAWEALKEIDSKWDTSFAVAALDFFESGQLAVNQFAIHSTRCVFGRTFALNVISDHSPGPGRTPHSILTLWPCPTHFWSKYYCTDVVFSAIDSLFIGYCYSNKSLVNHLPKYDGGTHNSESCHYVSSSQQTLSPGLGSLSSATKKTKISKILRKRLVAERWSFMVWFEHLVQEHVSASSRGGLSTMAATDLLGSVRT
jgi:hypothetical protein